MKRLWGPGFLHEPETSSATCPPEREGDRGMRLSERWSSGVWMGRGLIWLGFILIPLVTAVTSRGSLTEHLLTTVAALVFIAAYMTMIVTWRRSRPSWLTAAMFATVLGVSIALTLGDRPGWGFLFTYCAACTALLSSASISFAAVLVCAALAGVMTWLGGGGGGAAIGYTTSALGIGLLMLVLRDLRQRNDELSAARAELAQLAVARERERFARDLHDLLGHSLSVIAIKAELAGRLLRERPDDADHEIAELEQVARTALSEVREAVSGYRQPTLDDELAGARMALTAAGIVPEVNRAPLALAPEAEAVLAWAVREGATNVIRHSRATHCSITVRSDGRRAWVEIVDDGTAGAAAASVPLRSSGAEAGAGVRPGAGAAVSAPEGSPPPVSAAGGASVSPGQGGGHGLAGLAERAQAAGGELEAASQTEAGFRLAVTVPAG